MSGLMRVPFFEDELLTSCLSRTTMANGSANRRAFCSDVGLDYRGILRGDGNQVTKATRSLERPAEELLGRRVAATGRRSVKYGGLTSGLNLGTRSFRDPKLRRLPGRGEDPLSAETGGVSQ